jgi:hypothetical protein
MQNSRAVGTFPLSYLVSHVDVSGLPVWLQKVLLQNLPLMGVQGE